MHLGVLHVQFTAHDGRVFSTKIMLLLHGFVIVRYMVWLASQYVATILWWANLSLFREMLLHGVKRYEHVYISQLWYSMCSGFVSRIGNF